MNIAIVAPVVAMLICATAFGADKPATGPASKSATKPASKSTTKPASRPVENFNYRTDEHGMLIPTMSYPRYLQRTLDFFLKDLDNGWSVGNEFKDADGKPVPAYLNYAFANARHELGVGPNKNNAYCVYPGRHAYYIRTYLAYWRYTGDPQCLARARQTADWNLERRTPADSMYGSMFYSTIRKGKAGGGIDGDAIMPDKAAQIALRIFELSQATGEAKYRQAAETVATKLVNTQLPAGNWPFRVNPKTGEVREDYTSSVISQVMLFEALDGPTGTRWAEPKAKALRWILEGPVKTMVWKGYYEDIPAGDNRTNFDCIDTARWLIAHRAENPEYLALAKTLHDWLAKEFVDKRKEWADAEGLREQKRCFYTEGSRTLQWAALLADLYEATGEASYKQRAVNSLALVTYWMREDGANIVGPGWMNPGEIWFACHFNMSFAFDALSHFPAMRDDNKPHLIKAGSAVQDVAFKAATATYKGMAPGSDVLLLPAKPVKVTVAGQELNEQAWKYDTEAKTITLDRPAGAVEITW